MAMFGRCLRSPGVKFFCVRNDHIFFAWTTSKKTYAGKTGFWALTYVMHPDGSWGIVKALRFGHRYVAKRRAYAQYLRRKEELEASGEIKILMPTSPKRPKRIRLVGNVVYDPVFLNQCHSVSVMTPQCRQAYSCYEDAKGLYDSQAATLARLELRKKLGITFREGKEALNRRIKG